ncbi:hypothetical protein [Streptomyces sp. NPDC050535]|uniref:hypothetical protein n=1 Tax=Streptomyces sp. NPDC050535 TaxID=3365626 RepID=UPI0037B29F6F
MPAPPPSGAPASTDIPEIEGALNRISYLTGRVREHGMEGLSRGHRLTPGAAGRHAVPR